jgi:hypothetical protein
VGVLACGCASALALEDYLIFIFWWIGVLIKIDFVSRNIVRNPFLTKLIRNLFIRKKTSPKFCANSAHFKKVPIGLKLAKSGHPGRKAY